MVLAAIFLSSCLTTKTQVGAYRQTTGNTYTFAKGKQVWILGGLIPIGRTSVPTPPDGNCEVVTRYNVADVLISAVTLGTVVTYTIKVNAKNTYQQAATNYVPATSTPNQSNSAESPSTAPSSTPEPNSGEFQIGEVVYAKNSLGNSYQVTIEYINGGYANVVYTNAMGTEKRKKVSLMDLSRTP